MNADCKHPDCRSTADGDTGVHIAVCTACFKVTHICFSPLPDDVERSLDEVRKWGVFHAKTSSRRPSESAAAQQGMEEVISALRVAALQSRIDKNTMVEAVAKTLDEKFPKAAELVRTLKLEPVVK